MLKYLLRLSKADPTLVTSTEIRQRRPKLIMNASTLEFTGSHDGLNQIHIDEYENFQDTLTVRSRNQPVRA